jgi:beta-lactamase regulating signal transducer with metallopeptidase domain
LSKPEKIVIGDIALSQTEIETIKQSLTQMKVPANLMMNNKVTTTISVPEDLNKKIDALAKELDITKSLLLLLGFLFFLALVTRD